MENRVDNPIETYPITTPSSSSTQVVLSPEVASTLSSKSIHPIDQSHARAVAAQQRAYDKAVYWHIRAIRAMGRTNINTIEISQALEIPIANVDLAIFALKDKGVKAAT